jgi:hypothetical protein
MDYGSVVFFVAMAGLSGQQSSEDIRQAFLHRVEQYVMLHRELEAPLPREVVTEDPSLLFVSRQALAQAIRKARADARQGDIFSPAIVQYFRTVVADALREGDIHDMLAIVEEENTMHVSARVNADYPAGASIPFMPTCLLAALPPLPPELEYRFVARDLILWDVHAGLIVDFVPRAIRPMTAAPACR